MDKLKELRALIDEIDALPDPRRNLLSENERSLVEFCLELGGPLRDQLAALEAAPADTVEAVAVALWQDDFRLRMRMARNVPWSKAPEAARTKWRALARVALAVGRKVEADGWLPIDTAPHGVEVPCLTPDYNGPLMLKFYLYNGLSAWRDWDQEVYQPTHWCQLPPAPQPDKGE